MQDAIDINALVIHNSPDVRRWQPTIDITAISETPANGYELTFSRPVPESWKWPSAPPPSTDNFQYTVWFCALLAGVWHGAGFVQMWQGRPFTRSLPPLFQDVDGAPGYTRLWGDVRHLWGELSDYVPAAGDRIGIMVTAGNGRLTSGVTSVAERSNLVLFPVNANDLASAVYNATPQPNPDPVPIPPAPSDIARLEAKIDAQTNALVALSGAVAHYAAMCAEFQTRHLVGTVKLPYIGSGQVDLVFKP